jgi:hypothetical protein
MTERIIKSNNLPICLNSTALGFSYLTSTLRTCRIFISIAITLEIKVHSLLNRTIFPWRQLAIRPYVFSVQWSLTLRVWFFHALSTKHVNNPSILLVSATIGVVQDCLVRPRSVFSQNANVKLVNNSSISLFIGQCHFWDGTVKSKKDKVVVAQ